MGVVAVRQVGLGDGFGATHAFGDILPGHLDMDAASMGPLAPVNVEARLDLWQHKIERPGLVAASRLDGIAMHWIARPYHDLPFPRHGADQRRKVLGDLVCDEATDQRETLGLVLRVEQVDVLEEVVDFEPWYEIHPG